MDCQYINNPLDNLIQNQSHSHWLCHSPIQVDALHSSHQTTQYSSSAQSSPSGVHSKCAWTAGVTIAWASNTLALATPKVNGDLTPTRPSSDLRKWRILLRTELFFIYRVSPFCWCFHSSGIRFLSIVRKPIFSTRRKRWKSESFIAFPRIAYGVELSRWKCLKNWFYNLLHKDK